MWTWNNSFIWHNKHNQKHIFYSFYHSRQAWRALGGVLLPFRPLPFRASSTFIALLQSEGCIAASAQRTRSLQNGRKKSSDGRLHLQGLAWWRMWWREGGWMNGACLDLRRMPRSAGASPLPTPPPVSPLPQFTCCYPSVLVKLHVDQSPSRPLDSWLKYRLSVRGGSCCCTLNINIDKWIAWDRLSPPSLPRLLHSALLCSLIRQRWSGLFTHSVFESLFVTLKKRSTELNFFKETDCARARAARKKHYQLKWMTCHHVKQSDHRRWEKSFLFIQE